jgi:predicted RNA-binding Zn-ribbon protein involved in translation (DUF1610 family)
LQSASDNADLQSSLALPDPQMAESQPQYDPKDPYTLLCERCGYVIEGLDTESVCPECGKPIVESLPERRTGTPWQQCSGIRSLIQTWWKTIRHPKITIDILQLHNEDGIQLASISILLSVGFSVVLCVLPALIFSGIGLILMLSLGGMIGVCFGWLALFTLTAIEAMGLRVFGKKSGYRIDQSLSWAIVGHGCVGWVIMLFWFTIGMWSGIWYIALSELNSYRGPELLVLTLKIVALVSFLIGVPLGFIVFESFAYLGIRRCKYANRARA